MFQFDNKNYWIYNESFEHIFKKISLKDWSIPFVFKAWKVILYEDSRWQAISSVNSTRMGDRLPSNSIVEKLAELKRFFSAVFPSLDQTSRQVQILLIKSDAATVHYWLWFNSCNDSEPKLVKENSHRPVPSEVESLRGTCSHAKGLKWYFSCFPNIFFVEIKANRQL